MRPLIVQHFRKLVDDMFPFKMPDADDVRKMTAINLIILKKVFSDEFLQQIPPPVRFIIQQIYKMAHRYKFEKVACMLTGNMLFLRCLSPMLSVPEFYQVSSPNKGSPSQMARKSLVLQGKLLNQIANFTFEGAEFELDEQLVRYRGHIIEQAKIYKEWIGKLVDFEYPLQHVQVLARHDESQNLIKVEPMESSQSETTLVQQVNQESFQLIIKQTLQQKYPLKSDSSKIPLRCLACIHFALQEHKRQIYDCVQAMHEQNTETTSVFQQPVQKEKFERLILNYAALSYLPSSSVINSLNQLLILLQQPPPMAAPVDYLVYDPHKAVPKFYQVLKQNMVGKIQKRIIKFTNHSVMNVDGELCSVNGLQPYLLKKVQVKNEITAEHIVGFTIDVQEPTLTLQIEAPGVASQRTYLCENKQIRNQILGEIFELCYFCKQSKEYAFKGCVLKLSKDSVIKLAGDKIIWDFHHIRLHLDFSQDKITVKFDDEDKTFVDQLEVVDLQVAVQLMEDFKSLSGFKEEDEPEIE